MSMPDRNSDVWLAEVKRWVAERLAESGLGQALTFETLKHRPAIREEDIEELGFFKIDVLALGMLTASRRGVA